ncbi:MAG: antibiotic biosynthesis monooxygenase [Pseudomonadota bacterium]
MITITAVIRAKPGAEAALEDALLEVARYVETHEADTVGFHLSRSLDDPRVFTTYERFLSEEAKDAHNASPATTAFFEVAESLIEPPVTLHTAEEISAKSS